MSVSKAAGVCTRLLLGLVMFTSGMSKLIPFPGVIGPVWLEAALEPHGLGFFARFIAWSEAGIGLLLLSSRTRILGAIMLVPLLVNILFVTISLEWRGTPFVVGFLLLLNGYLLYLDRAHLFGLVGDSSATDRWGSWRHDMPALLGIAACLAGAPLYGLLPALGYLTIGLGLALLASAPLMRRRQVA